MQAAGGDRLHVRASIVGQPERTGEIVEVRGAGGEPPYLVRFDDGHTALVFPGPDAIIERPHDRQERIGQRPARQFLTKALHLAMHPDTTAST
jgi:hypothetical protein